MEGATSTTTVAIILMLTIMFNDNDGEKHCGLKKQKLLSPLSRSKGSFQWAPTTPAQV